MLRKEFIKGVKIVDCIIVRVAVHRMAGKRVDMGRMYNFNNNPVSLQLKKLIKLFSRN